MSSAAVTTSVVQRHNGVAKLAEWKQRWLAEMARSKSDSKTAVATAVWGGNPKIAVQAVYGAKEKDMTLAAVPTTIRWKGTGVLPMQPCSYDRAVRQLMSQHDINYWTATALMAKTKTVPTSLQPCLDCSWDHRGRGAAAVNHTFDKQRGVSFVAEPFHTYYWRVEGVAYEPLYIVTVYDTTETFTLVDYASPHLADSRGVQLDEYAARTQARAIFTSDIDPLLLKLGAELIDNQTGFCGSRNACKLVLQTYWYGKGDDPSAATFRAQVQTQHPAFAKLLLDFERSCQRDTATGEYSDYD
jgi:hypothetical protein